MIRRREENAGNACGAEERSTSHCFLEGKRENESDDTFVTQRDTLESVYFYGHTICARLFFYPANPREVDRGTATPPFRSVPVALPRIYSAELITRR